MSIEVKNLTKTYGIQKAVNNISFQVDQGEIVGFLGPNGAGKSTTMKIITGFIPANEGEAKVCGISVHEEPEASKKKIGYLPENNPLYLDMYVKEYLHFVAGIFNVNNKAERVTEMIELCGLQKEQHKKIGALSKGYRQRVGLAQALIHDPEVLILDEPTSGLDPNQLIEIRNLIKTIGKEKTVLFSSHIMQEVQAISDRVIIINEGSLVANDEVEHLKQVKEDTHLFILEIEEDIDTSIFEQLDGIQSVQQTPAGTFIIEAGKDIRKAITQTVASKDLTLLTLKKEERSLEQVFQELTQK